MWKKTTLPLQGIFLNLYVCTIIITTHLPAFLCAPASAVFLNANPVNVKRMMINPFRPISSKPAPKFYYDYYDTEPSFSEADAILMEPDDAVDEKRFSSPIDASHLPRRRQHRGETAPPEDELTLPASSYEGFMPSSFTKQSFGHPTFHYDYDTPTNHPTSIDYFFSGNVQQRHSIVTEATVTSDYKVESTLPSQSEQWKIVIPKDRNHPLPRPQQPKTNRNNFTDTNISHMSIPSKPVLFYGHPIPIPKRAENENGDTKLEMEKDLPVMDSTATIETDPLLGTDNDSSMDTETLQKDAPDLPVQLDGQPTKEVVSSFATSTDSTVYYIVNKTSTVITKVYDSGDNASDIEPSVQSTRQDKLSSGAVTGIVIAVLTSVTFVTSSVIYLLYRKYNGKCTSVVESKFNSDNCGYLDDSLRSSVYLNNHIELPKENSEEMTSLDNDSFLNSLETMTIQNYWADSTKNTKV